MYIGSHVDNKTNILRKLILQQEYLILVNVDEAKSYLNLTRKE